ncbi:FadR/GntR family transcriptional regulator [Chryseobacterium sp. T16E-39]|uniref:FadR/GntR family transcriptional regulator n=1 Tax=Chryseobacterium sp. T16E-39 TaxID=2015076 RepID=UPI001561ADC2|nr:FadR/GntR family transcriptional regulator [Chryseobacterium sp. T16E-39]
MAQIQKRSLAQEVAERLIEGILNDTYAIGNQLPTEPELMKIYGVGRSSIREAIKILSIKGVLSVQQGVGTFIVSKNVQESLELQMSKAEIEEVEEVRSLLESKVAARAAVNHTADELKTIKEYLDLRGKFAEEELAQECYQADVNFHLAIAEACGNKLLKEIYKIASRQVLRIFESSHNNNTDAFRISQKLHNELYTHIKNRDAEKASLAAEKIILKLL